MTDYFKVKNWDNFQHYKDRNPPWIKLHNQLLDNYEFELLGDSSKGHLLCIWMLASRTQNKMPYDAKWIAKIGASSKVDLQAIESSGFIERLHDASNMLHKENNCDSVSVPSEEKSRVETEAEKSRSKVSSKLDYSSWPEMPSEQTLKDWLAMRKRLKANVTQTVINRFANQLHKAKEKGFSVNDCIAECVVRNWRGFDVTWLNQQNFGFNNQPEKSISQLGKEMLEDDDVPDQD